MIPASFEYDRAETVAHALELLADDEDVKILAGGHSLVPALKLRIARPSRLVDIGRLSELSYVHDRGDHVAIGALTRHKDVRDAELLRTQVPLVSTTAGMIGDPQVRHRGTIGGSLAHGDPASDMPSVMRALDAEFVVRDASGERVVAAADFFTGVFETAASAPGTILTEVRVPKLEPGTGWSYVKYRRRAQDWATVGVAAVVRQDGDGALRASVALASMGGTPLRARAVEEALAGGGSIADAAAHAAEGTEPSSDTAASADYRRHLACTLTQRALEQARRTI